MFEASHINLSWKELLKRTGNETVEDDVMGLSAQLAYYFFLALFPAPLFLVALASCFPLQDLLPKITDALARFAPGEVLTIARNQVTAIARSQGAGTALARRSDYRACSSAIFAPSKSFAVNPPSLWVE